MDSIPKIENLTSEDYMRVFVEDFCELTQGTLTLFGKKSSSFSFEPTEKKGVYSANNIRVRACLNWGQYKSNSTS